MTDRHPMDQLPIANSQALSTLAANTGIVNLQATQTQNYKAATLRGVVGISDLTVGDGPFLWGISQGELSLTEIEEYLESVPVNNRQVPQVEHVQRAVQVIGAIGTDLISQWVQDRILLPTFREDVGFGIWIYNQGKTMTTGAQFRMRGRFFGRWLA